MVNLMLKNTQRYLFLWNAWNILMNICRDTFCICAGRDDKITTSAKLLDIMCNYYGLSADLIEAIK